jgi:transcriptional antiterminator RfaH
MQPASSQPGVLAWYAVRAQPKHEHIAAAHLAREVAIEVFLPRISFRRATRTGASWVTEALFPNYIFARFDLSETLRHVRHTRGVSGVVHFGNRWPTIPDPIIQELRQLMGAESLHVIPAEMSPGDRVRITGGLFHGLEALVTRVMPGQQRIAVLMELLGRQTMVELSTDRVVPEADQRRTLGL